MPSLVDETTDLLQHLIRNACVNDGTPESGHESKSAEILESYLRAPGVEMRRYEPSPGRASLVVRIEGSDRNAKSLHLMGHTDVVPVTRSGWQRDPFGGELLDGFVWGRGAIDMLDKTASMAVAVRKLIESGFHPRGTLIYSAVADEEAQGTWGAKWLVEHEWDDVKSDYLLTEFGGTRVTLGRGIKLPVVVAEKGSQWTRLRVKGTPGHGSMPYRSDNALVKAADIISRIVRYQPPLRVRGVWTRFVDGLDLGPLRRIALTSPLAFGVALDRLPPGTRRMVHALTHTTFSPNIAQGGVKLNVIPDSADVDIDIRTLPGDDGEGVHRMLRDAIGDRWKDVELVAEGDNPATESPTDTPLWRALSEVSRRLVPGATTVPFLCPGATDARFFRRKGVVAYGYGLMSARISFTEFWQLFHGNNERVDQETLGLMTSLWDGTVRELLGQYRA